jgi:hypothetical protein
LTARTGHSAPGLNTRKEPDDVNDSSTRRHWRLWKERFRFALVAAGVVAAGNASGDEIYINEIYFNPPVPRHFSNLDTDQTHQYVELRGTPNMSLTDHFLVFVENESGAPGTVEAFFDLGAFTLGANGFFTASQKEDPAVNNPIPSRRPYTHYSFDPQSTNVRNTGLAVGFGNGEPGASTVGFSGENATGLSSGLIEASGFTAFLIRTDGLAASKPVLLSDIDMGDDGLDMPVQPDGTGVMPGWTVLDSIGVFAEVNEAILGRLYSPLAFGFEPANLVTGLEPGAEYVFLDWPELEAEYIGRWGNSTGDAPKDWHVSNLTHDDRAGFTNTGDFRQSAEPHESADPADWESNQGVPYGTNLTNTLGTPNYPLNVATPIPGDFDSDQDVDGDDLTEEWMVRFGDDLGGEDFLVWQRNVGTGVPAVGAVQPATGAVPEPTTAVLAVASFIALQSAARRRFHNVSQVARRAPRYV